MSIQHMQHDHPGLKYLEAILIFASKAIRKGRVYRTNFYGLHSVYDSNIRVG